ncbi:MAG: YggS family pyridoxal phosphate-dependent enzyme [Mariprofundaceae bacterium]|nr:YggS family pyridoxal phosphate-dependent enzyme [Mariprofundaceae bacterium]
MQSELLDRWRILRRKLDAQDVKLLAVSKYAAEADVALLAAAGQQDFAESRPQQLRDRAERFPDVNWHMIGPLQKNKAKYIGRYAFMWHSVEDVETARTVAAHVHDRRLPAMLQVNAGESPHQHGVNIGQAPAIFEQLMNIPALRICGLMCMAPRESDARACFRALCHLRDHLASGSLRPPRYTGLHHAGKLELCMGMSSDYRIAIEEGSNMVRLGTALFG